MKTIYTSMQKDTVFVLFYILYNFILLYKR